MEELWFEDFTPGRQFRTTGATLSEAQILDFAWTWDPQPFHIDKEAAKDYGGIIASGFQTLLVAFRLYYQARILGAAGLSSPGFDELRWLKPVHPGDTISVVVTVKEARASNSKPDRGILKVLFEANNQHGERVMSFLATQIVRKRPA